jgi:hypothetical protein
VVDPSLAFFDPTGTAASMLMGYTYFYNDDSYGSYTDIEYGYAFGSADSTTGTPSWDYLYSNGSYYEYSYWGIYSGTLSNPYSTFSFDGTNLAWTWYENTYGYVNPYWDDGCTNTQCTQRTDFAGGSYSGTGDLDCTDTGLVDLWEITVAAGDTVSIGIDTVASTTTFDPAMYVIGPDDCEAGTADDSVVCTYPPPSYSCPSTDLVATDTGTYTIVARLLGNCADASTGSYSITVDATSDPGLTQSQDNVSTSVLSSAVVSVDLSGTITP